MTFVEPVTLKTRNQLNNQRRKKIEKVKKRIDVIIETLTTEEIEQITDIISADTLLHKGLIPKEMGKRQIEELRQIEKAYEIIESHHLKITDKYRSLVRGRGDHVSTATFEFGRKIELADGELKNNRGRLNIHLSEKDMWAILDNIHPDMVCMDCNTRIKKEVMETEYVEHLQNKPLQREEEHAVVTCVIYD